MSTFADLLQPGPGELPGVTQRFARAAFPAALAASRLDSWTRADASPTDTALVIGAATWSGYDLRLLEVLNLATTHQTGPIRIVVFDIDSHPPDELNQRIPFEGRLLVSPLVGYWRDGQFVESASGYAGRHLAYRVLGLDSKASDEFVVHRPKAAAV